MQVPAIAISGTDESLVAVRVHYDIGPQGGVKGTSFSYAERLEVSPEIIFWRYQFEPKRGMTISVESGEAYVVDAVEPPDDTTVKAVCVRLGKTESIGLPLPDSAGSTELPLPITWYPSTPSGLACEREFLPTPDLLTETSTHFYMGWQFSPGWLVRQKERNSVAYQDATGENNPTFPDLSSAWVDPTSLSYA